MLCSCGTGEESEYENCVPFITRLRINRSAEGRLEAGGAAGGKSEHLSRTARAARNDTPSYAIGKVRTGHVVRVSVFTCRRTFIRKATDYLHV
ncbi:Hypothetical protein NTJ_00476 [Nesidiocoris tenuis]|uniref:Uncharacterized protein n=1 Tax=Nesidiocoris tenuis TaxID=355587 RepID=A0ABN7A616_9HEMI|nr:Hypothetical protein NTJ_00476 [Nesidiocoris tenuis]